jgi:hypothetical protein
MRRLTIYPALLLALIGIAPAQNILINSGFEFGLMCFNTVISSNTGVFGAGDYRVLLSPDAHSGNYSIEISCDGSDCSRGGVFSDRIPTAGSTNYNLAVYTKCASGPLGAIYVPNTATGDIFRTLDCTGDWNQTTISFQTPPSAQDFYFVLFSYGPGFVRFDDMLLTYADGTIPPAGPLHPGSRNVSVSSQGVNVDGAPYMALGFFNVNYGDLAQVASTGANAIFGLNINSTSAFCSNTTQTGFLDRAYELGLNFVPDASSTTRLGAPSIMAGVMQKFGPHLANVAWMLADEPDQTLVPYWYMDPSVFLSVSNATKAQTALPLFADFQRAAFSVSSDVSPYVPGVDFFMAEPYGSDFQFVNHAADMFHSFPPTRPIWLAQDDIDASLIVPKAYWLLINGVTGIAYFSWDTFKAQPAKLAAAEQVFSEMRQLKGVIFSQNTDSVATPPNGIGYSARYSGGSAYLFAVNPSSQSMAATFQMNGLITGQQIQVLFENRTITANAGGFADTFAGVARHVYVIKAPLAAIAGSVLQKTGPDNARDWQIKFMNAGLATVTAASITQATFTQTGGSVCHPSVVSSLPVVLGDIPAGSSVNGDLLLNFTGCDTTAKFTVNIGLSANGGTVTNSIVRNNERK